MDLSPFLILVPPVSVVNCFNHETAPGPAGPAFFVPLSLHCTLPRGTQHTAPAQPAAQRVMRRADPSAASFRPSSMSAPQSAAGTVVLALTLTLALPEKHVAVVADSAGLRVPGPPTRQHRRRGLTSS